MTLFVAIYRQSHFVFVRLLGGEKYLANHLITCVVYTNNNNVFKDVTQGVVTQRVVTQGVVTQRVVTQRVVTQGVFVHSPEGLIIKVLGKKKKKFTVCILVASDPLHQSCNLKKPPKILNRIQQIRQQKP